MYKRQTLVVVCAATFMLLLDITIVIVALPTIQSELHASFSDMQWVIDAYALTLEMCIRDRKRSGGPWSWCVQPPSCCCWTSRS